MRGGCDAVTKSGVRLHGEGVGGHESDTAKLLLLNVYGKLEHEATFDLPYP